MTVRIVHNEAFMLMHYGCRCGHREVIWNSRNGVTPFALGCPSCGELSLTHVDWHRDTYAPDHAPHRGQRFFRDGTPEEAEAIMRARIEKLRGQYPLSPEQVEQYCREAREGTDGTYRKGWPAIDRNDGDRVHITSASDIEARAAALGAPLPWHPCPERPGAINDAAGREVTMTDPIRDDDHPAAAVLTALIVEAVNSHRRPAPQMAREAAAPPTETRQ